MRKLVVCLIAAVSSVPPAFAQIDANNIEMQFRGLSALASAGKRCGVADTLDERIAYNMAAGMAGDNQQAKDLMSQVMTAAKNISCSDKDLIQLLPLGVTRVLPQADGVALAYLDQGFCKASEIVGTMRLYSSYRAAGMSAERKAAAADMRKQTTQSLKATCEKSWKDMGEGHTVPQAVSVWDLGPALDGSCRTEHLRNMSPFECAYGQTPAGPDFDAVDVRFARQSVRAAQAKALALELDAAKSCKAFSAAERAAGRAQMLADAKTGLARFNKKTQIVSSSIDPEPRFEKAEDALAAGRDQAKALTCADLANDVAPLPQNEPEWRRKGEILSAASGAKRIHETLDRAAMIAVSLPACEALPNFAATKTAAEAYVAAMTPKRRLVAAAEAGRFMEELDRKQCKADALSADFKATPLFAVDALQGAWK